MLENPLLDRDADRCDDRQDRRCVLQRATCDPAAGGGPRHDAREHTGHGVNGGRDDDGVESVGIRVRERGLRALYPQVAPTSGITGQRFSSQR